MNAQRRAILLRVLVVVVVLTAVGLAWSHRASARTGGGVRGSGTVEATEIDVAAETVGQIVELRADEGDTVQAGQLIAVLKRSTLEADLKRAEAASYTAREQLADTLAGTRPEQVRVQAAQLREALSGLDAARTAVATAREAHGRPTELTSNVATAASRLEASGAATRQAIAAEQEAVNGPRPQELAQARAAVAQAEAGVQSARAGVAQAREALGGSEGELAPVQRATAERERANTQVAAAENRVTTAQAALQQALSRQAQVTNVPRPGQREQLQRRVDAARAAQRQAEQDYARAQRLYEGGGIARRDLDAAVSRRDQTAAGVREAEAGLADLEAGARQPERSEAAAAVEQARAALKGAEDDLANARHEQAIVVAGQQQQQVRATSAVEQGRARLDQAQAALDQSVRQREAATATLELLLAGTRPERVAQARAGSAQAVANQRGAVDTLRLARQARADRFGLRQQLETAQAQLRSATARVEAAQAAYELARNGNTQPKIGMAQGQVQQAEAAQQASASQLEDTLIRAPRAGTITEVVLREGETVSPGSVVVRMVDLRDLWVRIYLPVPQFGRIVRGQEAQVTTDAFPGKVYAGRVQTVSDQAEFTPKNTQTVEERVKQVFWVKVGVGDGLGQLKPGLPADVAFVGGRR